MPGDRQFASTRLSTADSGDRTISIPRTLLFATSASVVLASAAPAAAPQFDTPAKVAYLYDVNSGAVLYAKNPDVHMPPASMAKMMTTEVAFELIDKHQLSPDKICTVRPETWQKWHSQGSTMFLSPNEQVSVDNLIKGIVTLSGNDAAVVLSECIAGTEQAFTDQMNALAKKIGANNSHFGTANGWPDNGVTYVTARDLATIAKATIEHHPALYKKYYGLPSFTWGKTMGGKAISQDNRNPILGHVPGADGLKTGHTDEAGYGFTGSAEENGRRLIEVLAGMASWNQRVQESTRLIEWGFNAWTDKPLFKSGAKVGAAQVQMGSSTQVPLIAPRDLAVSVPAGLSTGATSMKIRYDGPLIAPIAKGQEIAQLVITTGDTAPQVVPLVAGDDVGRAGFFGRAWLGLKQLIGIA